MNLCSVSPYTRLNEIYRALDIYNFPLGIPFIKQLQALRVLYSNHSNQSYSNRSLKDLPTASELRTRLQNLSYEIYNTPNNDQLVHEMMDTALEIGASIPAIDTQRNLFREYERQIFQGGSNKPPVKDIYSLKHITGDSQNVHHTSINEHTKEIVRRIVSEHPPQNHLWSKLKSELERRTSWKATNTESLKFIYENPCTFTINITLRQLALSVFQYIIRQNTEIQNQLFQRFNEELDEMRKKCSSGHLSRLVNILQGFSNEYTIQIDPKKEVKAFIYHHLNKRLQEAPEDIQEGITDQSKMFKDFILSDTHRDYFRERFGTEHSEFIEQCMKEFIQV